MYVEFSGGNDFVYIYYSCVCLYGCMSVNVTNVSTISNNGSINFKFSDSGYFCTSNLMVGIDFVYMCYLCVCLYGCMSVNATNVSSFSNNGSINFKFWDWGYF